MIIVGGSASTDGCGCCDPAGGALVGGGGSPPGPEPLLLFEDGAFLRTTEGFYIVDAGNVLTFGANTPRIGSRGLLVERSFSNYALTAIPVGANWTAANGAGVSKVSGSVSPGNAPDGSTPATMNYGAAVNSRLTQTIGVALPDAIPIALTGFFQALVAGQAIQPGINASIDPDTPLIANTWVRLVKTGISNVGNDVVFFENQASGAVQSMLAWGCCVNDGTYPMTPTRAVGATFVSGADVQTYLAAQIPLELREGTWTVEVIPEWAPADLVAGNERWIISFGGANDGLRFRHDGADVLLEAVVGGLVVAASNAIVGAVREVLLAITVDAAGGTLDVNGSTGPAAAAWAWPGGVQARYGGVLGGANEADAYIGEPMTV